MIDALTGVTNTTPRASLSVEQVDKARKTMETSSEELSSEQKAKEVQPEELLNQIKALTENGLYSVRFENDEEIGDLIVKIVDRDSGEIVREIPPEDLRELTKHLNELRGNLVDTLG